MAGSGRRDELERRWELGGRAVDELGLAMTGYRNISMQVTGLSIRAPRVQNDDFLVTVKAIDADGAPWVAFHGSPDLLDALRGVWNRLGNGSLKWREDRPFQR